MQNNYKWQEMIFNSWFEKRVVKYREQRQGKFCDSEIVIKHSGFVRTFNACYKRFQKHYTSRNECFCDCIMLVWEGITNFAINDDSNWQKIATGNDPKNYGKLMTYCKNYVIHELERQLYPKISTSRTIQTEEGKKRHLVYYNIEPESLNRLTTWKNEKEKVELINCLEESYWTKKEEYKKSLFVMWAKENAERVLSKKNVNFLKRLTLANYSTLDKEYEVERLVGMSQSLIKRRLKRIYEKLAKAYKKEEKYIVGGFAIQTMNAEMKVYKKILNVVYNENIPQERVNIEVSKQIIKNMSNTHIEKLLYDKLDQTTLKVLIKIYKYSIVADGGGFQLMVNEPLIPSKFLYKIVNVIEEEVATLTERIEEEVRYLQEQAKKENVKVEILQFPSDLTKYCIHLRMTGYGIAVPKYDE